VDFRRRELSKFGHGGAKPVTQGGLPWNPAPQRGKFQVDMGINQSREEGPIPMIDAFALVMTPQPGSRPDRHNPWACDHNRPIFQYGLAYRYHPTGLMYG